MGAGMAEFISADEVESVAQYDTYCHYVAGLVGVGLSQMFGAPAPPSCRPARLRRRACSLRPACAAAAPPGSCRRRPTRAPHAPRRSLERPRVARICQDEGRSNHMGLFLQKANIIRDYLVGAAPLE